MIFATLTAFPPEGLQSALPDHEPQRLDVSGLWGLVMNLEEDLSRSTGAVAVLEVAPQ